MQFRYIKKKDKKEVINFCVENLAKVRNTDKSNINVKHIREIFDSSLISANYITYIAEKDNEIIGVFSFYVDYKLGTYDLCCNDILILVKPEKRNFIVVKDALKIISDYCIVEKVQEVCLGISLGYKTEMIGKLYKRLGFKEVSNSFTKRLF